MRSDTPSCLGYRFPPEIINHAVWLYHRLCLSFRDVEDLLAQRGSTLSCEAIRLWSLKLGPEYARALKRRQGRLGDTWHLDEVFVTVQGRRQYLWRAVDQDGDVIDILVQPRRDPRAAKRSESLPCRTSPGGGSPSSGATRPRFHCLAHGDVCRLTRAKEVSSPESAGSIDVNLTVPFDARIQAAGFWHKTGWIGVPK